MSRDSKNENSKAGHSYYSKVRFSQRQSRVEVRPSVSLKIEHTSMDRSSLDMRCIESQRPSGRKSTRTSLERALAKDSTFSVCECERVKSSSEEFDASYGSVVWSTITSRSSPKPYHRLGFGSEKAIAKV